MCLSEFIKSIRRRTEYEKFKKFCINKYIVQDLKKEDFDLKFSAYFSYPFPDDRFKLVHLPGESRLIAIDYGISDIIEYLNSKEYYTRFCCEGHKKDSSSGYIYFESLEDEKRAKLREVFKKLREGETGVKTSEDYGGDIFRFYSKNHEKMLEDLYKLIKEKYDNKFTVTSTIT